MENSEKGKKPIRGSTMKKRGPWVVRRATKKGTVTCLRFPSDIEREKNKTRERMRRMITSKIFSGLRAHGGYDLPNNADNNLVLIALCQEAGWHVQQDGSISRKDLNTNDGGGDEDRRSGVMEHTRINLTLSL